MKKEREDLNSSPSLLEPDGAVAHATGGAECRQSSRSCSDEYAEYYLPNAILLHFLPPFCFLRCNNRVLLSPGVHRHEGTHTLDVGSLAHLLDLD